MPSEITYQLYVGVDIAAATFTASRLFPEGKPDKSQNYHQTLESFRKLELDLLQSGVPPTQILVVLEATGNYWISLAVFLHQSNFVVSVVNPQQSHNYAKSLMLRCKNDQLDAQTLAKLAQSHKPAAWTPPPQLYHELQQRLNQREALNDLRQQVRNQLHALLVCPIIIPEVQTRMEELLATFDQQIHAVEAEIKKVVKHDEVWGSTVSLLQTIPGIGLLTACWLVMLTLNFTSCKRAESLVMYAGLAPIERTSGSSVRGKPQVGGGGQPQLRKLLYMAALSASQHNPPIRVFFEHLVERGKAPKVARCAAARKLLHLAFAVAKSGKPFQADYQIELKPTVLLAVVS
jgi:transposase